MARMNVDDGKRMDPGSTQPEPGSASTEELVRRITECQLSLYSFITSLVSNHNDAEDIRQEAKREDCNDRDNQKRRGSGYKS